MGFESFFRPDYGRSRIFFSLSLFGAISFFLFIFFFARFLIRVCGGARASQDRFEIDSFCNSVELDQS